MLGCDSGGVGEKFFAVDKYFRDFFAICCDFALAVKLYARQTPEQVFYHRIGRSLIRFGIVFHRVLHYLHGWLHFHHCGFAKHDI